MTFLTDAELAQLRVDILETLFDSCRIERETSTNTNGYISKTWSTVATVACRLDPKQQNRNIEILAERESDVGSNTLTVPYDADVRFGDRVVFNSETYYVTALWESHSARAVRRADVTRVRGG
jgi:hypothetical protein